MTDLQSWRQALIDTWRSRGGVADELETSDSRSDLADTLAHVDLARPESTIPSGALTRVAPLAATSRDAVELGDVIGEGAMGTVRVAVQTSLDRTVAVKQLEEDAPLEAMAALLREALVAGRLEHPNIIPIHALYEVDGAPLLVMKRIEGRSWGDALHDPDVARDLGIDIDLDFHVEVLIQLCRAVHFAHSRGILHLDVKPDNVMLGRHGEVNLLDWGLAVSIDGEERDWLPRAEDVRVVCGTPAYMAPEMAAGDGARLGVHTDVYQLGAVLHEILTGAAPHAGGTVVEQIVSAYASQPSEALRNAPPELADICRRAMAREPAERFRDAEALRHALLEYRTHCSSSRLLDAACQRLDAIRRAVVPNPRREDYLDDANLERLFAECRFGLEQARETWADNPKIGAALQDLITLMAERALRRGALDVAASLVSQLPWPVPALTDELRRQRQERGREATRRVAREREQSDALHRLRHDFDVDLHRRRRAAVSLLAGALWFVWNVTAGHAFRTGIVPADHPAIIGGGLLTLLLFGGGAAVFGHARLAPAIHRRMLVALGLAVVALPAIWFGAWRFDVAPLHAVALSYVFFLQYPIAFGALVDRRALWPGLAVAGVCPAILYWPGWTFEILAATGFLYGLALFLLWRRPQDSPQRDNAEAPAPATASSR